jgi:nitric oxide reductase subunit B
MNYRHPGIVFIITALLALLVGVYTGSLASFQFLIPGLFDILPFIKSRPLHVTLIVSWIFSCAVGGIYYYLPKHCNLPLYSKKLVTVHYWLFILTGVAIIISYLAGKFGGREYWEFPPVLSIPIIISWLIFTFNFFKTTINKSGKWPVYLWMWGTGIAFFLYSFLEANLWVFSYFNSNMVREITIQWKAYGSIVGSWNMLVYGTAIFVMEKINGDSRIGLSKIAFSLYFLGLINLMFGWAHHTYFVPSSPWIRHFAYFISMTELIILGKIIWNWKTSLVDAKKLIYHVPFYFLLSSEIWIFLNLILAILISVPAINIITHGTHITVAHAMGSTIGINTMILLASVYFIIQENTSKKLNSTTLKAGIWVINIALFIFWISLILAGYTKGVLTVVNHLSFQEAMVKVTPYLVVFAISGIALLIGITIVIWTALKRGLQLVNS